MTADRIAELESMLESQCAAYIVCDKLREKAEAERDGHKANYLSELDRRVRAEAENIILHEEVLISNGKLLQAEAENIILHEEVLISNGKLLQAEAALASMSQANDSNIAWAEASTLLRDKAEAALAAMTAKWEQCRMLLKDNVDACGTLREQLATARQQTIEECSRAKKYKKIGWACELYGGKLSLIETDLPEEDLHHNGRPIYELYIRVLAKKEST